MRSNFKDLTGKQFGNWTIIKFGEFRNKGESYWICKCNCKNETIKLVKGGNLVSGKSLSCGCNQKNISHKTHYKGTKDISLTYFNAIKNNAKRRKLKFNIDINYIQDLLEQQKYKCALSGISIIGSINRRKYSSTYQEQTASLDRIDSSKGYIKGNIQWIHKDINNMKQSFNEQKFIHLCIKIVDNYKRNIYLG